MDLRRRVRDSVRNGKLVALNVTIRVPKISISIVATSPREIDRDRLPCHGISDLSTQWRQCCQQSSTRRLPTVRALLHGHEWTGTCVSRRLSRQEPTLSLRMLLRCSAGRLTGYKIIFQRSHEHVTDFHAESFIEEISTHRLLEILKKKIQTSRKNNKKHLRLPLFGRSLFDESTCFLFLRKELSSQWQHSRLSIYTYVQYRTNVFEQRTLLHSYFYVPLRNLTFLSLYVDILSIGCQSTHFRNIAKHLSGTVCAGRANFDRLFLKFCIICTV